MPVEVTGVLRHLLLAESDSTALALEIVCPVELLQNGLLSLLQRRMVGLEHDVFDWSIGNFQSSCRDKANAYGAASFSSLFATSGR